MFHVPAHKYVGPNQPAQFTVEVGRGRNRQQLEVQYHPLQLVIGGHRLDFALHETDKGLMVSDPQTGRQILRIYDRNGTNLLEQACRQVRDHVLTIGEDEFFERLETERTRHRNLQRMAA